MHGTVDQVSETVLVSIEVILSVLIFFLWLILNMNKLLSVCLWILIDVPCLVVP
jgi:hypothetical protein